MRAKQTNPTNLTSLTALLGTPVTDRDGRLRGRLKDIAVETGAEAGRIAGLILRTGEGDRLVEVKDILQTPSGALELRDVDALRALRGDENFLRLQQDIVDRQIVDVHGRKVVRANDVDLQWFSHGATPALRVSGVDVGLDGAVRRLLKGLVPRSTLESFSSHFATRVIPWELVDVIEVDPARRVKLKIEHVNIAQMHPSDIADILEDLAPAERKAVFTTLDEELAAEALEEVDPKLQKSLIESLDSGHVADIVEEMDPGAAADLLGELPDEKSEAILKEMEPEERQEVSELLEFREDSAAGRMTTDYVAVPAGATVADAVQALRTFDGDPDNVAAVYLVDESNVLQGIVPLGRLVVAQPDTRLAVLTDPRIISCHADLPQNQVAELFDKYNLQALPVLDSAQHLVGVIQADHVIAFLRQEK
ncbi:MAG TPA: CBS domain-containing protein [Acidisarcina sp.]|nr:CBS domain-containing protein [Acidisarcina sp.]